MRGGRGQFPIYPQELAKADGDDSAHFRLGKERADPWKMVLEDRIRKAAPVPRGHEMVVSGQRGGSLCPPLRTSASPLRSHGCHTEHALAGAELLQP